MQSQDPAALKLRIQELEAELAALRTSAQEASGDVVISAEAREEQKEPNESLPLLLDEYRRYGRQMIMPEIGFDGQLRLKRAKVLIVGAGGLGSPAAAYIAGAGVGTIGIIDHDTVEHSNLHRQIIHSTSKVGMSKVESAITYLKDLNPNPTYIPHVQALTSANALSILTPYDLILDCTDHPSLRYLISDTAIILNKPIVSASALRTDGQLIVLNDPPGAGPCYRCIWPNPPPASTVTSCGEGGILGPVVGVMGVLQALEAIKLLSRPAPPEQKAASMTIFSAFPQMAFRTLKMRGRRKACVACGEPADAKDKITREAMEKGLIDHIAFCGSSAPVGLLKPEERVDVSEYMKVRDEGKEHTLLDVRDETQFGICKLEGSLNIPYSEFESLALAEDTTSKVPESLKSLLAKSSPEAPVYVLCRLGNDSQHVTKHLKDAGVAGGRVFDIKGGISEWAKSGVAGPFPQY
ncbi:uncharacterized protein H6S33_010609 [Morchella sextelata]|uniref:uncharacterized protein n=1 Tax=Morchella sextelata TaxID=1174677 RepID=UPI001D0592EC|nr:uncharacterized protein H6S33_010609 [Morchella sextelata]KAH0611344.1 hypothetical protein H6S33_010609 [Morchella sextelata]